MNATHARTRMFREAAQAPDAVREQLQANAARVARLAARLRSEPELRNIYLRGLAHFGADTEAAAQIMQMLKVEWDADLAAIYRYLRAQRPVRVRR